MFEQMVGQNLDYPGIVQVYEFGTRRSLLYIGMNILRFAQDIVEQDYSECT